MNFSFKNHGIALLVFIVAVIISCLFLDQWYFCF